MHSERKTRTERKREREAERERERERERALYILLYNRKVNQRFANPCNII